MYGLYDFRLEIRNSLFTRSQHKLFLFNMFILIVFIDFKQFFKHDLLWTSKILSFIIIEFDEQAIKILSFKIDMQCIPLAM